MARGSFRIFSPQPIVLLEGVNSPPSPDALLPPIGNCLSQLSHEIFYLVLIILPSFPCYSPFGVVLPPSFGPECFSVGTYNGRSPWDFFLLDVSQSYFTQSSPPALCVARFSRVDPLQFLLICYCEHFMLRCCFLKVSLPSLAN